MIITDVAPRDGLQNQPVPVSTENKLRLIRLLAKAGLRQIEATSFVSPKAVPQMADAADVLAGIEAESDIHVSVLVPNLKGLERACAAGAREIAVVMSATDVMNRKNINMGLAQAADVSEATVRAARASGISARAYVAVAWECPFEGSTRLDTVIELAVRMRDAGAHEIVLADTIGAAGPAQVRERLSAVLDALPASALAVHFHDTRGLAVANAWAALEAGIRRFDASTGGIGGCPFAPGAAGNLATEDLVLMAEQSGFSTGVDYHALLGAVDFAQAVLGRPVGGHSTAWARRRIAAGHRVPT
jgi:hydroxymethylglutaryl-CoA lyase